MILPPPDIKIVVEKTAQAVAASGPRFEELIREKEQHNSKFAFLNPADPYREFYDFRLSEIKQGRGTPTPADEAKPKPAVAQIPPQPLVPKRQAPPEPTPLEFLIKIPPISAQDLAILKLTAQFVARNGRNFMHSLSQRERSNVQFDFLKPSHSLFAFFNRLVDQYSKILMPSKSWLKGLKAMGDDESLIMDDIKVRVEYNKYQNEIKTKARDYAAQEKIAFAQIDWHDFLIFDTIEFTESDETMDLPPPLSLMELQNMSLKDKQAELFGTGDNEVVMSEAMDEDDDEGEVIRRGVDEGEGPNRKRVKT